MEYRVLGPVEVRRDGQATALSGRLQRVLFGVLLARANQPVPVDALTDALWGDRPDPRTGQKLQLRLRLTQEADNLRILGIVFLRRGDDEQALRYLGEALAIARAVGDTGLIAEILSQLGATHAAAGRLVEALQCLSEALAVAAEDDHREVQAHAHADIADVHVGLGDHAMAREHRREALGYYENLGLPDGEARLRQRLTYLGDRTTTAGRCWPRRCHR